MSVATEHVSDEARNVATALRASPEPVGTGRSFPLGATVFAGGVNFSVFSRQATRVELLLFDSAEAAQPARVIDLDPRTHRTYHYWHVFVPGIGAGQLYAYRAFGPFDPERGSALRSEQGSARSLRARRRRARGIFPPQREPIRAERCVQL